MDVAKIVEDTRKIYRMLEDEESKYIYMNRLSYVLSGDIRYMANCIGTYLHKYVDLDSAQSLPAKIHQLLRKLPEDRKMVLYGAGGEGALLLPYVKRDKRFAGFCSSTKEKQKNGYLGCSVMSPEELLSRNDLSVVISTSSYRDDLIQLLKDNGYPQNLVFDATAYYVQDQKEGEQYFGPEFMKFEEEEVFVDAGCYDFSSTRNLAKHCKCVKKVYAFEPDPDSYQKCLKAVERRNRKRIIDAKVFPNGVWSEKTTLHFAAGDGVASCVCTETAGNDSEIIIPALPIDEVIDLSDRVTMIKMDIEGSELEALKGAKETIQRDKPKLAICIYHKPEDMWEIPLYIKELVPEYRLYIRHHTAAQADTVLYAVMP